MSAKKTRIAISVAAHEGPYFSEGELLSRGGRSRDICAFEVDVHRLSPLAQRIFAAALPTIDHEDVGSLPRVIVQSRQTQEEIDHKAAVPDTVTDPATRAKLEAGWEERVRVYGEDKLTYRPKAQFDFGYVGLSHQGVFDATKWLNEKASRIEALGEVVSIGVRTRPYPVIY